MLSIIDVFQKHKIISENLTACASFGEFGLPTIKASTFSKDILIIAYKGKLLGLFFLGNSPPADVFEDLGTAG